MPPSDLFCVRLLQHEEDNLVIHFTRFSDFMFFWLTGRVIESGDYVLLLFVVLVLELACVCLFDSHFLHSNNLGSTF